MKKLFFSLVVIAAANVASANPPAGAQPATAPAATTPAAAKAAAATKPAPTKLDAKAARTACLKENSKLTGADLDNCIKTKSM